MTTQIYRPITTATNIWILKFISLLVDYQNLTIQLIAWLPLQIYDYSNRLLLLNISGHENWRLYYNFRYWLLNTNSPLTAIASYIWLFTFKIWISRYYKYFTVRTDGLNTIKNIWLLKLMTGLLLPEFNYLNSIIAMNTWLSYWWFDYYYKYLTTQTDCSITITDIWLIRLIVRLLLQTSGHSKWWTNIVPIELAKCLPWIPASSKLPLKLDT